LQSRRPAVTPDQKRRGILLGMKQKQCLGDKNRANPKKNRRCRDIITQLMIEFTTVFAPLRPKRPALRRHSFNGVNIC
jgi:hypothetical protein